MTGIISGIKRMEIHDGDGIRTTVFFKGCPLRCVWCHNPESISRLPQVALFSQKCISCGLCGGKRDETTAAMCPAEAQVFYGREYTAEALVSVLLSDKPFFDRSGGGVTLSGGECLAQPEFAVELCRLLKENGVSVYIDTCGYVNKRVIEEIIPYADCFLYDIKAISPQVHRSCTGRDNRLILENLKFISSRGCKIEIRYPLVKGYNDGECEKIAEFLKDIQGIKKVTVLRYHSFAESRYLALGMENTLPKTVTEKSDVIAAEEIFRAAGLPV